MQAGQAVDGKSGTVTQNGTVDLGVLSVGTYTVRFTTNVADGYTQAEYESGITVRAVQSTVVANSTEVNYGEDAVLNVNFTNANNVSYVVMQAGQAVEGMSGTVTSTNYDLDLGVLPVGTYTVRFTTNVGGDYISAEYESGVIVRAVQSTVNGSANNVTYGGEDVILTVNSTNASSVTYELVRGGVPVDIDNAEGFIDKNGQVTFSGLDAGHYAVRLTTVTDGNYSVDSYTVSFTVAKATTSVNATNVNVTYGEDVKINVSFVNATSVHYVIESAGRLVTEGNIAKGQLDHDTNVYILDLSNELSAGTYTVEWTTVEDDNLIESIYNSGILIRQAQSQVNASDVEFAYDDAISIPIEFENVTGVYYFIMRAGSAVKEGQLDVNLIDGTAKLEFGAKTLPVGSYTLLLRTNTTENYTAVENRSALIIKAVNSTVNASATSITYGEDPVRITIEFENAEKVRYEVVRGGVLVNNENATGDITATGSVVELYGLSAGSYAVRLTAVTDGNYSSVTNTSSFTVAKAPTSVNASDVDVIYGEDVLINVSFVNATSVNYIVAKGGERVLTGNISKDDLHDGVATLNLTENLFTGTYSVAWLTVDDDNLVSSVNSSGILIRQAASSVNASNVSKYYGESITIDIDSQNATAGISYTVFKLNDVEKSGTINVTSIGADGKATLTFEAKELAVGNYTLVLNTLSFGNYTTAEGRSVINVLQAASSVNASNITKVYGEAISIGIDSQNATDGIKYSVIRAGVIVKSGTIPVASIGADGKATLAFAAKELPVGEYTLLLETQSLGNYTTVENRSAIVVVPANSSVNASNVTKKYGEDIAIDIDSQNATAGINYFVIRAGAIVKEGTIDVEDIGANGKATLTFVAKDLSVGEYTLLLVTQSYGNYTSSESRSAIIVTQVGSSVNASDITKIYGEEIKIDVESENATAGIKYYVMNAGKAVHQGSIDAADIDEGKSVITIPAYELAVGDYTLLLVTQSYGNYSTVENRSALIVNPANSEVTAHDLVKVYGENIDFTISSLNATQVSYVVLDGEQIIAGATIRANVTFTVPRINSGNYTIRFTTIVDGNHSSVSVDYELNITKAGSNVSVPDASGVSGNVINLRITGENATGYIAKIYNENNNEVENAIISIVGEQISISGLESGNYTLNVSTVVDENNYYSVSDVGNITVLPVADLIITPTVNIPAGQSAEVGQELRYTIKVTNVGPNPAEDVYVLVNYTKGDVTLLTVNGSTEFGEYNYDSTNNNWTIGTLNSMAEAELVLVLRVNDEGDIVSRYDAYPIEGDGNPADNTKIVSVGSEANADVLISVNTTNPDTVRYVGDKIVFNINVSNSGPSPVTNLNFTGLFDNLKYIEAESNASYSINTHRISIGTLGVGESFLFHLVFEIESEGIISANLSAYAEETDHNLNNNNQSIERQVYKKPSFVDSNTTHSISYGDDTIINITLLDGSDHSIPISDNLSIAVYKFNDGIYDTLVYEDELEVEGSLSVNLTEKTSKFLDAGSYMVKVEFAGNNYYYASRDSETTFIVNKASATGKSAVTSAYDAIVSYGYSPQIYIGVDFVSDEYPGEFAVNIYDNESRLIDQIELSLNGTVNETLIYVPGLEAGNYTFNVFFKGNENYDPFTFYPAEDVKNLTVDPVTTILGLSIEDIDYHENIVINLALREAVSGKAVSGNVKVIIVDKNNVEHEYDVEVIDGAGTYAVSDLILPVGNGYQASAVYQSNRNYIGSDGADSFDVNKVEAILSVNATDINYGEASNVTVCLTGVDGLLNATVPVYINGVEHNVTVKDGEGSILVSGLDAGYLYVNAEFKNNETYKDTSAFDSFRVFMVDSKLNISINDTYLGKDAVINVELNATNGTGLTGIVIVSINETDYQIAVVDGTGSLNVSGLTVGDYDADGSFIGDTNYKASNGTDSFKVYGAVISVETEENPISYGDRSNLIITLIDTETNSAIANAKVSIIVGSKEKEITLNESGQYEFGIEDILENDLLAVGDYPVEVVFDSEAYGKLSDTAVLVVSPIDPVISEDSPDIDYSENETITITLPNDAT
ncbi:hypothetical protein, partial [uncultured Methanobrevibacter sp.]|uniref:hypothetical protein n=1 Tax=uncultured Methanobrevibacter sp. TaxID=253161 RepID=UPI002602A414